LVFIQSLIYSSDQFSLVETYSIPVVEIGLLSNFTCLLLVSSTFLYADFYTGYCLLALANSVSVTCGIATPSVYMKGALYIVSPKSVSILPVLINQVSKDTGPSSVPIPKSSLVKANCSKPAILNCLAFGYYLK
jgi:hypothetical protein